MNAKVGDDNLGEERTMVRHGFRIINNNGEQPGDWGIGTLFPHSSDSTTHTLTWFSPIGCGKQNY